VVLRSSQICVRISWYSWLAAPSCEPDSVPRRFPVASVHCAGQRTRYCRQRAIRNLQKARASLALAGGLRKRRRVRRQAVAIDSPAGSSAPELIFEPEDNCVNTFCRLDCVWFRLFSA